MKKALRVFLAMTMMTTFITGCGQPSEQPSGTPETTPVTTPSSPTTSNKTIGVSMPTQSLQRWNQDGANMKKELEAKGYVVDLQYAEDQAQTQISKIENMITKGAAVLVIAAIDGEALTNVLKTAADKDIKVIAYDRLIRNSENVDYYATYDNFKVGQIQGNYIVEALKLDTEKGPFNIEFFGGSPDDNDATFFNDGAMSVLQPYLDSKVLVNKSGQVTMDKVAIQRWASETAQARMDNLIAANYTSDKLDVVLSPNDSLAIGIIASLKATGYGSDDKPFPIITGQDCDIPNVKAMINGEQSMSVFKDTRTLAAKVVEMVEALIKGTEVSVNDEETYDNGVKIVPSFLCEPVFADKDNYKELLIDSGYYTEDQLK